MKRYRLDLSRKVVAGALGEVLLDASLGAVCGALYGASFGSFALRIHGDYLHMLPNIGFWALCIAAVVAAVSSLRLLLESVTSPDEAASKMENFGSALRGLESRAPSRQSPRQEKTVSIASV